MLSNLINEAGFPPGVLNIVTGCGKTGEALAQHKLVDKISFTGSTEVGYLIMKNSHKENIKPVTLELGGKSANIIFEDADIDEAVSQATIVFSNAGQSCIAGSRTYVHESLYDQFIEKAKTIAEGIKVGDPMKEDTQQGPQVSKTQFDRVMGYIESGKQ
jgi:aldehyde dehydrogenase (NAD+)